MSLLYICSTISTYVRMQKCKKYYSVFASRSRVFVTSRSRVCATYISSCTEVVDALLHTKIHYYNYNNYTYIVYLCKSTTFVYKIILRVYSTYIHYMLMQGMCVYMGIVWWVWGRWSTA